LEERGTLVPGHVGRWFDHVVSVPSRDGDEVDLFGVVSDLLDELRDFLLDLVESGLAKAHRLVVHLVDGNDELLDTQGVREESMFTGLTILGNTGFEFLVRRR